MIEIKKSELEPILLMIATINRDNGKIIAGLLTENIPLGTKRSLQKIRSKALDFYKEFLADIEDIKKECEEDKEKLEKELLILIEEKIKIDAEPFKLSSIENVSSSAIYDFELLEKIGI